MFLAGAGVAQDSCSSVPAAGDTIVTAVLSEPRVLVPILASDSASAEICGLIFNGLLKYDKDLELTGDLAERWEIKDSGLRIIFHLRKNVRWHDGEPFTARDVEFTYKKLTDPSVATPYSGDFLKVRSLRVLDPYTVEIVYHEVFSPGLASWTMWIMPRHLLENEDLHTTSFSLNPVGTGPYRWKAWKRQEKIELTANQDYFEGAPYLQRFYARVIPESSTAFLELQTRGIDAAALTPLQFTKQTHSDFFKTNYRTFELPGFGYTYLGYNLENPKFRDKRVRQALELAVNKEEIMRVVLLGKAEKTTGPFLPQSWAYDTTVEGERYDPGKAKELLARAGWQDSDADGILDKNGEAFEFEILTNQGNEQRIKTAEMIQKYLKDAGIRVKIKVLEWSALLTEFIQKGRFEAVLLGWALGRDPDCYDIWHSSKTRPGEFNFLRYSNPRVDQLLDEARKTFSVEERREKYHEIHRRISGDHAVIFLYASHALEIISSRFCGIRPAANGIAYNFIRWWVPLEKQRYKTIER
ncbi:MAG: peptide-binding protein [Candidatus Omnitrophota bacterium]